MQVPAWLGPLTRLYALSALLPNAAEDLCDSLGITLPVGNFQPRVKVQAEEKPVKSTKWVAEERHRKRRELGRRILDDADTMMLLMALILHGPTSLSWACTLLVPETLPGGGTMTADELARRRDAARKHIWDSLVPALRDYWGLVTTWKVEESTDKAAIQNGEEPIRNGQIVIEPTDLAFRLLGPITEDVRDRSLLVVSAFFPEKTKVGKAIESDVKAAGEREAEKDEKRKAAEEDEKKAAKRRAAK